MATRLGSIDIVIKLDTREAERALTRVERESVERESRATLPGPSGLGVPHRRTLERAIASEERETYGRKLLHAAGRQLPANRIAGPAQSLLAGARNVLPETMSPGLRALGMAAGGAALLYGVTSGAAKMLPQAFAFGKQLVGEPGAIKSLDPRVAALEQSLGDLRRAFVNLETYITSVVPAMKKQIGVSEASLRLTGELPNTEYYRKMFLTEERAVQRVDDKFKVWKAKESPFVTLRTLADTFRRQMTR